MSTPEPEPKDLPSEDAADDSKPPAPAPDPNAVLRQDFSEYIKQFWVDPVPCPICKHTDWTTANAIDLPLRYGDNRVFTVIPVVCNTCKHVLFFNAVSAGLFENGQPRGLRPDTQAEPEK